MARSTTRAMDWLTSSPLGRIVSLALWMTVTTGLPVIAQSPTAPPSVDTADPIEQVIAAGYMTRDANGDFRGNDTLTRAELAVIISTVFELTERIPLREAATLQDVPTSHWAYDEIQLVLRNNIMSGYAAGLFYPSQPVSRAEAFSIVAQAYGVAQFPDENINSLLARYPDSNDIPLWGRRAMATSLYQGFVNLSSDGNIRPLEPMTRADMAYALNMYLVRQEQPAPIPPELQYRP